MKRTETLFLVATLVLLHASTGAADPPGVVIDRSPDPGRVYVGCPSIAVLPGGDYVASHSWFGPGTTMDRTAVFRSADRGQTWQHQTDIHGQWWSNLFVHREKLYIMGVSARYGHVVIRRSDDGGRTWTEPKDGKSGLLLADAQYHTAPVPVVVHNGRVWRAMEDAMGGGGWGKHFRAFVMSAPTDADLLDAASWTSSNRLATESEWLGDGWLEGNVVVTPEGEMVNILRVALRGGDKAAIVRVSDDGRTLSFNPENDFIDFPGGSNKFSIRRDDRTKRYWALVNKERDPPAYRNVLTLTSSADLRRWKVETVILRHYDSRNHAWQYPDWQFDGNDLVAASRTAWDGSHNAHDANYFTFHRIEKFRDRTMADAPPYLGDPRSAAPPVVDVPGKTAFENADWRIEGSAFRMAPLDNDARAYGNRTYVWEEVPQRFHGGKHTQTFGGIRATMSVTARRDATLHVATAAAQTGIDMTGWQKTDDPPFHYTDKNRTRMSVFRKELSAGDQIIVPQGNWSGTIVLLGEDGR